MVRNNDWLFLSFDAVAVLFGKHIYFSLVKAKLTDISFEEENVCALHARVQNLRSRHVVSFSSPHDLTALLDPRDVELPSDVDHNGPVLISSFIDFVGCPQELHVSKVHSGSFPNFDEVPANDSDFL